MDFCLGNSNNFKVVKKIVVIIKQYRKQNFLRWIKQEENNDEKWI